MCNVGMQSVKTPEIRRAKLSALCYLPQVLVLLQAALDKARDEAASDRKRMHSALGEAQDAAQRAERAEAQQRAAEAAAGEARAASDAAQHARLAAQSGLAEAERKIKEV